MDNEDLKAEIYHELDMIRFMTKLSNFAVENEANMEAYDWREVMFRDIHKKCWQITELVEKIQCVDEE